MTRKEKRQAKAAKEVADAFGSWLFERNRQHTSAQEWTATAWARLMAAHKHYDSIK